MDPSLLFAYVVYSLSIILLIAAGFIYALFIIPLQYKEAKVRNGLARLRKQMLIKGILALFVIAIALFSLTGRFFIADTVTLRYLISTAILAFSGGILGKAIIDYLIYHQQFSPESKALHEQFEKHEIDTNLSK